MVEDDLKQRNSVCFNFSIDYMLDLASKNENDAINYAFNTFFDAMFHEFYEDIDNAFHDINVDRLDAASRSALLMIASAYVLNRSSASASDFQKRCKSIVN